MAIPEFHVGDHQVRPELNELRSAAGVVHVEPKVMDVLVFLAERPGEVVTKDELLARVWPGTFIQDTGLFRVMSDLRRALGDPARSPRYVETIPKRGYRLIADVRRSGTDGRRYPATSTRWSVVRLRLAWLAQVTALLGLGFWLMWHTRSSATPAVPAVVLNSQARVSYERGTVWETRADCAAYPRAASAYQDAIRTSRDFRSAYENLADSYLASAVIGCQPASDLSARMAALLDDASRWGADSKFERLRAAEALWFTGDVAASRRWFDRDHAHVPDVNRAAFLLLAGRPDEAIGEARRAWAEEPAAVGENWTLATLLLFTHRYREAADQYDQTLELYPTFPPALEMAPLARLLAGDADAALRGARLAVARLQLPLDRFSTVPAYVLARLDRHAEAARALDAWTALSSAAPWVAPTARAVAAAARGASAESRRWLDVAEASHDPWMAVVSFDPIFAGPVTGLAASVGGMPSGAIWPRIPNHRRDAR